MFTPSHNPNRSGVGSDPAAQAEAREGKPSIEFLEQDIERLLMITEALWMLLKAEHGYTDKVLADLIKEIDLRDGNLDGRVAKSLARVCPSCGKPISKKHPFCMHCGKAVQIEPFAR